MSVPEMNRLQVAAKNLATDAVAREVASALSSDAVDHILLKGPSTAVWLYEPGTRPYGDIDLIVSPREVERANAVLERLGFTAFEKEASHARTWVRGGRDAVDLHHRVPGSNRSPEDQWMILWRETEPLEVAGRSIMVLRPPTRALHLALHVAQHGLASQKPLDDLDRLLEKQPEAEFWRDVVRSAEELDAEEALSAALRLLPPGALLADELHLPLPRDPELFVRTHLKDWGPALGLRRLRDEPTLRGRLSIAWKTLFPPGDYMRHRHPAARRGPATLAALYAVRPLLLLLRLARGLPVLRRASRKR